MLKIENLAVSYTGAIKALKGVDLEVNKGEIVVLIGANGAGKTTLLRALTGLVKAEPGSKAKLDLSELKDKRTLNRLAGERLTNKLLAVYNDSEVVFDKLHNDEDISSEVFGHSNWYNRLRIKKIRRDYIKYTTADLLKVPSYDGIRYGFAHVPEGRQVFANLTVQENLEMGAFRRHNSAKIKDDLDEVFQRFPRLKERRKQKAGTLSGGEQQMLAVARALMSKPKIIFLDEPSMGLSPLLVSEVFNIIKELNEQGITILLVEQNAKAALSIADRGYVLENGRVVLTGTGESLLNDERVKTAYLGS